MSTGSVNLLRALCYCKSPPEQSLKREPAAATLYVAFAYLLVEGKLVDDLALPAAREEHDHVAGIM